MAARDISLFVKVQGAPQAARDLARVTAELHRVGQQSRRTSDLARNMGRNFSAMGNEMAQVGRRVGYTLTAMATAATYAGIKFNATMESQKVAFESFLGSKKAADAYVKSLVAIATATPFKLMDVVQGTRHLLAFGMEAKAARHTMQLLGNAIATSAGGAEEIERSTRALGQIQAAGVLHAQDLNQLIQANVLTLPQLTARMGTTTKKFRKDMSLGKVTAEDFFAALRESWAKDPMYRGAAEKQMKTFNGQLERTKDLFERAMGAMTFPLFEVLRKKVLPAASETFAIFEKIWDPEQPRAFSERANESMLMLKSIWGPLKKDLGDWWAKKGMTEKLKKGINDFVQWFVPKMIELGKDAARGMWEAWKDFDPKTKAITATVLLARLGITQTIVAGAAGTLWAWLKGGPGGGKGSPLGGALGAGTTATMHVTAGNVYVTGAVGGGPGGGVVAPGGKPGTKAPSRVGRAGGMAGRVGKAGGLTALAMGAYAAATGANQKEIFQAMDPTQVLGWFGLPSIGKDMEQYAGSQGWGELWGDIGRARSPHERWGDDVSGAFSAAGGWLGGAASDVGGWMGSRWKGGIRTNGGKWYPNQAAADAALIGGLQSPATDTVLRPTPPDVLRREHAEADRQNLVNRSLIPGFDPAMWAPTVIVQVDGKAIATAVHNAGTKKKSAR